MPIFKFLGGPISFFFSADFDGGSFPCAFSDTKS